MAGADIRDGCIRIRDGKIAEIGKRDEVNFHPAPGERVIEAGEGLVMPGLIEAHCHMGITEEKKGMEGDDCNETVNPITPCLRAIDAALDAKKANWPYIKAILQAKQAQGVRCLADWDALEERRQKPGERRRAGTGNPFLAMLEEQK